MIDLDFGGSGACHSCHKFPLENPAEENTEEMLCNHCKLDRDIGKDLPKPNMNTIVFCPEVDKGAIPLPNGSALLTAGAPRVTNAPYLTVRLNSTDLGDLSPFPAQSKFVSNYIPKGGDGPMTFEDIAKKAKGRHYLGFLKMDADNMGAAMVFGLKRGGQERGLDTVSRLATLSRQIEWFFSGWVQHLLSHKFKNCYTVFSGGDDLFLVGPWSEILDLAGRVRDDYSRYTGNPQLTVSAGIVIEVPGYPISQAAKAAREAVKLSKDKDKDRVTILGHTLKWQEWAEIEKLWQKLRERVGVENISTAFLYSLLEYGRMWREYKEGNISGLRFQSLLAYNVGRNLSTKDSPTIYQWAQEVIALKLDHMKQKQVVLDNLGLLARLLILSRKRGEE